MRSRSIAVAAIFIGATALSTTTATADAIPVDRPNPTPQTVQEGPLPAGSCGEPWGHRKVIKKHASIKKDYYNASPSLVTLDYGDQIGWHDTRKNTHGNKWHKVSYSTRTHDYCGWMSDNWID